ncbi:MAG: hypothetical protein J2P31_21220, partial [Blastocatellia bacterium]|nr:hypothetical protein [Blastocatellia bacterium]
MLFSPVFFALTVFLPTAVDRGYAAMYNLEFPAAHRDFQEWRRDVPVDPMGPVGDAAAYLFAEFARLHILESEFFTDDRRFSERERRLKPDPAAKAAFESAIGEGQKLATNTLARSPHDENALLASVLAHGLHSDYLALIEQHNLAALSEMKQTRQVAERLLR